MADHITQEVVNNGLRSLEEVTNLLEKLLKAITDMIAASAETKLERELAKYLEKGGIPGQMKADKYAEEIHKRLEEAEIPHMVSKLQDGYGSYVLFRAEDLDRVNAIRDEILLEKGELSETTLKELMKVNYGKKLGIISDLDDAQLNTLREKTGWLNGQHSKKGWEITTIAFERQENGLNRVYFRAEDKKKINIALGKMAWELTGEYGKKIRAQEEYDVNVRRNILQAVREGVSNVYIVSAQDPTDYIKIESDRYTASHGQYEEIKNKDDQDFEKDLLYHLERMSSPVIMTAKEFAVDSDEKEHRLKKLNKRPKLSQKERDIYEKERRLRELVEQKMLQYNSSQNENTSSLYNGDVTLNEYLEHELVNEIHDTEELNQIKAHFSEYVKQVTQFNISEIVVTERDIDTVIEEEKKKIAERHKAATLRNEEIELKMQ